LNTLKFPIFILLGILAFSACEKDDICIDADTPLLVIRFYDIEDTTEFKDVQNLVVRGLDATGLRDTIANAALDSIALPLRVDQNSTSFILFRQLDINDQNTDTITLSYEAEEIFASRACGYIVNYENLQVNLTPENPDSLWIKDITIDTAVVQNSASAHVKIFH
jgi:hypothetical protein